MGIHTFQNPGQVDAIDSFDDWGQVILTVYGPGDVWIESSKERLEMAGPGSQQAGAQFTAANTNPPYRTPWIGTLFAVSQTKGTQADFTIIKRPRLRPDRRSRL